MDKCRQKLALYIALSYLAQGLAQHFCLLSQPLDNFLLKGCHWDASQVASFMALLMVPWTIKPVFGFIADGFLLFGSTKKLYLSFSFLLGAIGYVWAAGSEGAAMTLSLLMSSAGMACASA